MLYKDNSNIYVFANNKYYKVKLDKDIIVAIKDRTQKEIKYKLSPKAYQISAEDAKKFLKGDTSSKEDKDNKNSILN